MGQIVAFETADGGVILVEVDEEAAAKAVLSIQERVVQAQTSFEEGLDVVRRNAEAFISKLRTIADPPDEVEVTFGLKLVGEVGSFVVAKAGAEANYEVKLTWRRGG